MRPLGAERHMAVDEAVADMGTHQIQQPSNNCKSFPAHIAVCIWHNSEHG